MPGFARSRARSALLLALVMLGAYVAPAAAAAGLRAQRCCAERCAKPRSASAAGHCCQVVQGAVDVGAFTSPDPSPDFRGLASVAVLTPCNLPQGLTASRFAPPVAHSSRAAPVFLHTLSLRL